MKRPLKRAAAITLLLAALLAPLGRAWAQDAAGQGVVVGAQYDTTHVYVAPADIDGLITSFTATFGGKATPRIVTNVLPVPSSTESQAVLTPSGNLSVFAFLTPVPFPFGRERNGYLVTDMDQAVTAARQAGAEVVVAPFRDPIGRDAVIEWPGGVKMQLYWHMTAPASAAPLPSPPENRVYVSPDRADAFARGIVAFGQGTIVADDASADAAEIGRPGETFRRIRIESRLGKMLVFVTDGHLPYPFGLETTGYEVADLTGALKRAEDAGARLLSGPFAVAGRTTAVVAFPGGYIAEIHKDGRVSRSMHRLRTQKIATDEQYGLLAENFQSSARVSSLALKLHSGHRDAYHRSAHGARHPSHHDAARNHSAGKAHHHGRHR